MKKLVFYSDQVLPEADKVGQALVALLDKSQPRIGYIPSRADPQRTYYEGRRAYYARLGLTMATYFELDEAYDPARLDDLLACDAIHLSGGNTYYFLHWLRRRGMLAPLRRYVAEGGVLVGVSAGAILMTPDIGTAALCGDEPLPGESDLAALHLVDFTFVPHLGEIPADLAALQAYSHEHQGVLYACRDGEGVVVDGDQVTCIGDVTVIINGELTTPV